MQIPETFPFVDIEVVDGALTEWETDVFITFDNLAQEVNVSYSAEDIKTVLTVKGEDDLDIREVNMGLPYMGRRRTGKESFRSGTDGAWVFYSERSFRRNTSDCCGWNRHVL